jgi:NhaA family Na+:H+ antiporter
MIEKDSIQKLYPFEKWKGQLLNPLESLLSNTISGGLVLMLATIIALLLANSSWSESFHHFWEQYSGFEVGNWQLQLSVHHWVNDGFMALFFLLVGLELKREFLVGELASIKEAMLPIAAALGGMIVPALIYTAFNWNQPTLSGWGIPMATDIAFAVGVLLLLGNRIPRSALIFLMALAIVDDLGAVLVIALFYTSTLNLHALLMAALMTLILIILNRAGVRRTLPYMMVGGLLWYVMLLSGIHATIAGVILAMCIPARPALTAQQFNKKIDDMQTTVAQQTHDETDWSNQKVVILAQNLESIAQDVQSPLQRTEHSLSRWVTFLIIPIFALGNAGIDVRGLDWLVALTEPVTLGVTLGLVFGKLIGITLFSWLAAMAGLAKLPNDVTWMHIIGIAWLSGIGFTMSLFVSQLAFTDAQFINEAKLGILVGSFFAMAIGLSWLLFFDKFKKT